VGPLDVLKVWKKRLLTMPEYDEGKTDVMFHREKAGWNYFFGLVAVQISPAHAPLLVFFTNKPAGVDKRHDEGLINFRYVVS